MQIGRQLGLTLHGGMGLNAANPDCLAFLQEESLQDVILSPELTIAQTKTCTGLPVGAYAYGYQPVMTMRNCPIQAEVGCKHCTHHLIDRTGRQFPVYCRRPAGITTMYNAVPHLDGGQARRHFPTWISWCWTAHCSPDVLSVLHAYRSGKTANETITRGLFFRGVE